MMNEPAVAEKESVFDLDYDEFVKDYESRNPEPALDKVELDKFVHKRNDGGVVGAGWHFDYRQGARHFVWLIGFMAAHDVWLKKRNQILRMREASNEN